MKIHALYFDAKGCGPAELSLALRDFAPVHQNDDHHLGMQFKAESLAMVASPANGGLYMARADVEQLHRELGAWLAAHPARCDFREGHDRVNDRPTGPRCTQTATHRIEWEDGRHSFGCADHLTIDADASVKPTRITKIEAP